MAGFLGKYNKKILLLLAEEFDTSVSENDKNKVIIQAIVEASDYDEVFAKERLEGILTEKKEREEKEREEELRQFELLKLEKEQESLEKQQQFELEKLRIQNSAEVVSNMSNESNSDLHKIQKINLKDLVPRFDSKLIDITLFFMIFERQAEKAKISQDNWVSQLIPLLPTDIAEIIVKQPADVCYDFQHIKKVLLNRFRLGTGALRQKFENHQRKPGALWVDLVYELRGYLDNWLESIEVKDFESLKELILTEQFKKRVPFEIKEKFMEEWDEMKEASTLADKCDKYDNIRSNFRKSEKKTWEKKHFQEIQRGQGNYKMKNESKFKSEFVNKRDDANKGQFKNDQSFEKRKKIICYYCKQPDHIKPNCTEWLKLKKQDNTVNHLLGDVTLGECFKPYLKIALINGVERNYLRDTGAGIDLCDRNWIKTEDLTGETTWIRQPLDTECKCLPLAWVTLEGDFGYITTKAAIKPVELEQGYYILGNKTAELMKKNSENAMSLNMVITRSKNETLKRKTEKRNPDDEISVSKSVKRKEQFQRKEELGDGESKKDEFVDRADDNSEDAWMNEDITLLPEKELKNDLGLNKITAEEFSKAQKNCLSLKILWDKASTEAEKEFKIMEDKLVRVSQSNSGEEKIQLCVPLEFRNKIMIMCHEEVAGHLGATKTKDRVIKCYFWPNCYKEIEDFVRTCDICQKVGNNRDRRKAPLKLVPIISEVFSRINIDGVGPLILSEKNNRYLITSICVASKYPDAIPVESLTSACVIDGLLQIFSRTGFPREIQCDLGRSFTSELTSEFFDRFGIKVMHSSLCHPESNSVERMHGSLKKVLKALCLESGKDWESVLPMALFSLRTVTHESTGFSPAELIHGKNLRMPHTLVYENWMEKGNVNQNIVDYILNLSNRLKHCQELAGKKMKECQEKRKLWYDRNAVYRKFKVGDKVLVLATSKRNKMAVNWIGPGTITAVISETNYTIDIPEKRNKSTIYHVNLIKHYYSRPEFVNLMIDEEKETIEEGAEIPYPIADPTQLDFWELVKNSGLQKRLSTEQIGEFLSMIERHRKVFSTDPGSTPLVEMDIVLTDNIPVRLKPYRMSPRQMEILREEIRRLLDLGVIEVGQSDYASPMILVESTGKEPRPCVDYRKLNAKTRTEFFPLPNIEEVVERVSAAPYITVMDLTKGYFQIPLTKEAQRYAAFVTPFGTFIPKVMMFGLLNSAYYFCRLIAIVLSGLESFAVPYIDDIAIFSMTWEQHLKDVDAVLKRLREANLTVKPIKCKFAQDHVKFLGHEVGSGKRSPGEAKLQAIKDFPIPTNKTQLRAYLGLVGYYSRYIKNYANIAVPLTNALRGKTKKEKIQWNDECNKAFEELKAKLMKSPILYAPDFSQKFIVQTDASLHGAGIVLSQIIGGEEHPILYLSKKFSRAEQNYSTIERELAAIIFGLKKLNYYLDGQKFEIQTDHNPLVYLKKMVGTNSRLTRWALFLQSLDFEVVHKPGKLHGNADGLSRKV